jgi:hypothetical protein
MIHFSGSWEACTGVGSTTSWQGILLEFETRLQTFRKIKILYHGIKKIPEMWEKITNKLQQQRYLYPASLSRCVEKQHDDVVFDHVRGHLLQELQLRIRTSGM